MDVLISPSELADRLTDVRLLDVRWTVMAPNGRPAYLAGHLPGAVFVDLDADLADHSATGRGRHPLPTPQALQASARRWGLNDGDAVVVYDDWNGQAAARGWWLLRAAGVSNVRILDGGWAAWQRSGGPVATEEVVPAAGDITINSLHGLAAVDADAVAAQAQSPDNLVFDARAAARYRGDEEPLDPRAGHIPGAVSAPTAENLTADGTFKPVAELRERFEKLGAGAAPVTVYCGSGVTATHQIAALAIAGYDAALYPGSWSEWSSDPQRPVATGPTPA
ncbi:sulfurtransferase [Mycobacteroides immunogenum]|uniref:Sulfurtransferase n=1 Tax=Mycobacteroides immunogenum TaxID=83262 RepID=A0A7V8RX00_9MYCO|nr:sulfurtransferase [Mycobacteroides immunogenum]AMT69096.1 thiosulfate sulfurtransferase [Mycobacteroides immunogenum]ANO02118.1 thiosulfate sulfurtransferase [Mycobacteroides immunogenum]KIU40719.1 thiosulfate sulfurtransferase [Mycobacteroides immunogenum]KPG11393.1 thiosulfate sulfurtransferase [Mycobacteroides immunogenum]KPG12392.1 thiosulfate sulfurtransferase [Mycobacteroides immunogenum]